LYVLFSMLGNIVLEIFYAFTLLDLVVRNDSLKNVVKSVTLNGKSLVLTGLFGFLLIYYFAIWATIFLQSNFTTSESIPLCSNVFDCWMAMFEYALLTGGSPNNGALGPPSLTDPIYADRFIFDMVFFLLLVLIFLNVFFGIILDTFGELRGNRQDKLEDIKNNCFICSINRTTFDRQGNGFDVHIRTEHYIWYYLYYIVYLNHKLASEFTGIEQYVYEKIKTNDISWFPMNKALVIDDLDDDDKESPSIQIIHAKLEDLYRTNREIMKKLHHITTLIDVRPNLN